MSKAIKRAIAGMTCLLVFGAVNVKPPKGIDGVVPSAEASSSTEETPPMKDMMRVCDLMMAQMGGRGGMAPEAKTQAADSTEPTEHGTKQADGFEITLVSAQPLSSEEMRRMMPGMEGMMADMSRKGGARGNEPQPTHWIGVVVRDVKGDRAVPNLDITLTAKKGDLTRTAKLMPMPGSYGANVSLPEKGRYTITATIARPGQPVSIAFPFDHKEQ